ncbi:MAG: hypothetical protein FJZ92_08830 [Chloroflexi bacterium]|nr:hypothetical protein [Chloroflexota bacterium]
MPRDGPLDPEQGVEALRRALGRGEPWYPALLGVIRRWSAAEEVLDGVAYRYLIAGEAFDWLLLAGRLLAEVEEEAPADEVERLLLFGLPPADESDDEFELAIGAPKYRAHLNFQYGVVVEELLLLSVEMEYQKAGRLIGAGQAPPDVAAYEHVYGKSLDELQVLYRAETESALTGRVSQHEWQAFTYWCSKYRVRTGEPARVASDTRKAVALMSRMEAGRARLGGMRPERVIRVEVRASG